MSRIAMRLADPYDVDFEILPVGIGQQAADDTAVRVACKHAQQLEVFYGKRGIVRAQLRYDERIIVFILCVGDFDFHD